MPRRPPRNRANRPAMDAQAAMIVAMENRDVDQMLRIHMAVMSHLPRPASYADAEKTMHMATTATERVSLKARAYSHAWLTERGFPSLLPDRLKRAAERLYPKAAPAVGISVNFSNRLFKPAAKAIEAAMSRAVAEVHADGKILQTPLVRERMQAARMDETKRLFGSFFVPPDAKEKATT